MDGVLCWHQAPGRASALYLCVFSLVFDLAPASQVLTALPFSFPAAREENVATFRGSEYLCYDLSQNPIQSSSDEITLSFKTWQRNGLILHTGKSADYVNLALKDGAVSLVINLGSGAFEAIVEPVNGKFNDNAWHDVKVTRNLRQVMAEGRECPEAPLRGLGREREVGDGLGYMEKGRVPYGCAFIKLSPSLYNFTRIMIKICFSSYFNSPCALVI